MGCLVRTREKKIWNIMQNSKAHTARWKPEVGLKDRTWNQLRSVANYAHRTLPKKRSDHTESLGSLSLSGFNWWVDQLRETIKEMSSCVSRLWTRLERQNKVLSFLWQPDNERRARVVLDVKQKAARKCFTGSGLFQLSAPAFCGSHVHDEFSTCRTRLAPFVFT